VFGYGDDHIRFSLFSRTVLEWLTHQQKSGDWMPDVIHCNDWHTGYVIDWGRRQSPYQSAFRQISFVYTVHNFSYQGNYDFRYQSPRDDGTEPLADILNPALQRQNPLLRGILYADSVNTVSPTHAIEVTTPEYAEGLEDVLLAEKGKLSGILNGLDTREFNPLKDPLVKYRFSKSTAHTQRPKNKTVLQKQFFLDPNPKAPLLTFLGRLAPQKGWDLLFETLPHLLSHIPDTQLIVVGNGDDLYRQRLFALQKSFPKQIGLHLQSDFRLPRMLFAGGDMMLIPSMFEPGGIVALEALRYGNVPIIRRTGGLNDIVTDFDPHTRSGNGFSFKDRDPWALFATIVSAITLYRQPSVWHTLIYNAMESDFSWEHSAKEYDLWYADARKKRIRALKMSPHPAYIPQRI
jgi:starch synthase